MSAADVPSTSAVPEHERPILDYVPETLKRLARFISKCFHGKTEYVVMEYIIKENCIREEDLRILLKFDQRELRKSVLQLRQDKLVKERQATEEYEGKQRKINYYFPNYRAIVNVAKYKVDHMRQKLEAREKTKTHRSTYKCSGCKQAYDALEMNKIYNAMTGGLTCWSCHRCGQEVVHDESVGPAADTRDSLARFNEQMTALFSLVQQLDGIRLAPHLLEPKLPVQSNAAAAVLAEKAGRNQARMQVGERAFRATDANRSEMFRSEMDIRVTIDDGKPVEQQEEKAAVPWLAAGAHAAVAGENAVEEEEQKNAHHPPEAKRIKMQDDEILGLLREEMDNPSDSPSASQPSAHASMQHADSNKALGPTDFSSMVESKVEPKMEDEPNILEEEEAEDALQTDVRMDEGVMEDGDDEVYVTVAGTRYPLDAITTELVEKMTESEKKAYTEISMSQYEDY